MEHLTIDLLNRYGSGNLAGEELLAADDHLSACEDCRRKIAVQTERAAALVYAIRDADEQADTHLTYNELQSYIDGDLPPGSRTQIADHLAACPHCRAEAEDLKKWADELNAKRPAKKSSTRFFLYMAAAAAVIIATFVMWPARRERQPLLDKGLGASDQALLSELMRSGKLPLVLAPDLQTSRSQLLGDNAAPPPFKPLSPIGYTVLETTPELRWQALPGATTYQVKIFDSSYKLVETSPMLNGTIWRVTTPLDRNTLYSWQIIAIVNQQTVVAPQVPDAEARFSVLSEENARAAQEDGRAFAGNHLLLAAKYAQFGLCQQTLAEIQALKNANPASPIAGRLEQSTRNSCPMN